MMFAPASALASNFDRSAATDRKAAWSYVPRYFLTNEPEA
jgi:hypothetical protein